MTTPSHAWDNNDLTQWSLSSRDMKEHILQLLQTCGDINHDDGTYELFEELIDGCDIKEDQLMQIENYHFDCIESLYEFLFLERRRWKRHYESTGKRHWISDERTFDVFCHLFVRGALLDRKNYLVSQSENNDRLFFVNDGYDHSLEFNNFIYYDPRVPMPHWNRLVPSFNRKFQGLHSYISLRLDHKERQVVYWYFSIILLLYTGMSSWDKVIKLDSKAENFISWCHEETMMCQYLIRRYCQSFYQDQYLKQSIDGSWSSSTQNHHLNRVWYKGKRKFQNKARHLKRAHPDQIEGLAFNDPLDMENRLEIASLLID